MFLKQLPKWLEGPLRIVFVFQHILFVEHLNEKLIEKKKKDGWHI